MPPATLHGVTVISKLYFAIFAAIRYHHNYLEFLLRGHSRLYILAAIKSQCTTLYTEQKLACNPGTSYGGMKFSGYLMHTPTIEILQVDLQSVQKNLQAVEKKWKTAVSKMHKSEKPEII